MDEPGEGMCLKIKWWSSCIYFNFIRGYRWQWDRDSVFFRGKSILIIVILFLFEVKEVRIFLLKKIYANKHSKDFALKIFLSKLTVFILILLKR